MKRCILWIMVVQLVIGPIEGFARIIPKEGTEKVAIKKGDTLWELARRYFNDPTKWPEFNKFNQITNPSLIHPGEKLGVARGVEEVAIERKEAESLLVRLKQEKEKVRADLEERDKMIKQAISELKTPLPSDVEDLIIEMKLKIDDLEVLLSEQKTEKEREIFALKRERDELKDKMALLNSSIAELTKKLSEAEEKALAQEMEIASLKKENQKLKKEKREIKTFAYFLTAGAIAGLAIAASSD